MNNRQNYPFTAIVGQERMKQALTLNAVNPRLGGILIRGEKGTAKSTAVRALAELLPELETVTDCFSHCDPAAPCPACAERLAAGEILPAIRRPMPVVDLPIGATEDRLVGTLDLEQALQHGKKHFEPGILAAVNRGMLYVDEVNLLDDHLVDLLLDSAAMGVNTVEREGISITHPASFVLVGTMNPEEGELRPQILDRFGLCVTVEGITDIKSRMEVVRRRAAFETDPAAFRSAWLGREQRLAKTITRARDLLPAVRIPEAMLALVARISVEMEVDGHRADLVMMKTALTLAALAGRKRVREADVREAAFLALPHRMRRLPFEEVGVEEARLARVFEA